MSFKAFCGDILVNGETDDDQKNQNEDEGGQGAHRGRDGAFLDFGLDEGREGIDGLLPREQTGPAGEGGYDEVVQGKGDRKQEPGEDAREDLRHGHLPKGLALGAA